MQKKKLKLHCIYSQLENKLLIKVINYFVVEKKSQSFHKDQWRSNLQQCPYKHSTFIPLRNSANMTFSCRLHVVSIRNTRSVFPGLKQKQNDITKESLFKRVFRKLQKNNDKNNVKTSKQAQQTNVTQ